MFGFGKTDHLDWRNFFQRRNQVLPNGCAVFNDIGDECMVLFLLET